MVIKPLNGRGYAVVPVVMMVEGVLNGSQGALYYPAEELAKCPEVWNHKPLVVYHPAKGSATNVDVLTTSMVGIILNTRWDAKGKRLIADAWIDIVLANRVDERIIDAVKNNRMMEVSTGLWTENEQTDGAFNGREYAAIARNYRPDHLAILPDQIGACSIADGAGLCRNEQGALIDFPTNGVPVSILKSLESFVGNNPQHLEQSLVVHNNASEQAWLANAPPVVRAAVAKVLNEERQQRDTLVAQVLATPGNKFSNEWLSAQPLDVLNNIVAYAAAASPPPPPPANYYGAGAFVAPPGGTFNSREEGYAMPTMNWNESESPAQQQTNNDESGAEQGYAMPAMDWK